MSSSALHRIRKIISRFKGQPILVIGDIMLDTFIWGKVSRISPEAPIPVVEEESTSTVPGGAANVACNIASLGGKAYLSGIVGKDREGREVLRLLEERGVDTSAVQSARRRKTIVKTRIIAHHQHVVRIDREDGSALTRREIDGLVRKMRSRLGRIGAVIFEDYGKGIVSQGLLDEVVRLSRGKGVHITADPKIGSDINYTGVDVIAPNRSEACYFAERKERDRTPIEEIGKALLKKWQGSSVLVTLGEEGMCLFEKGRKPKFVETKAREVFDVAGAGDTVIAAMTMGLAAGATLYEAAEIANIAAGIVVGKSGVNTVGLKELMNAVKAG